ncbi:MAG: Mfa1 family fimbria major subunit [Prevotella sp.]|nr:Mfa1 family fimbria major subunit [Prevotella sp.]
MSHSSRIVYALLLAGAVVCGCSQREDIGDVSEKQEANVEMADVVFKFQTNVPSTSVTRGAEGTVEDSGVHVTGTVEEYQVNNARVYLFDSISKLFVKSILLTNLVRTGVDADGYVMYQSERLSVPQGTYDVFVVANSSRFISKQTETEFLADIDSLTYNQGVITDISKGIVMTNRANENLSFVITKNDNNEDNVLFITLERVLARIDVAKSVDSFELKDELKRKYASVTLDGYYIVNMPKYYYSFRRTAVLTSLEEPEWNINENFGKVKDVNGYVIDPYFFKKSVDASHFTNADNYYVHYFGAYSNPSTIAWMAFNPANADPQYNTLYSLENCTLAPAQKNGYSTGIIFRAKMEPYNNVYHLGENGLELIGESQYPEVLYYFNYKFYDSAEALAEAIGVKAISPNSLDLYQAQKFEKDETGVYHCYYVYWIRHLDNLNDTVMGVMEFAIVRNNLYRILVANVSGLGYYEIPINPDTPDEGEAYLKVVINVKPWIVRDLTNIVL